MQDKEKLNDSSGTGKFLDSQGRCCGFSFKRNGSVSYLVLSLPLSQDCFLTYQHKQLTYNRIKGLLPFRYIDCGEERQYCYDITSTIPIMRYLSFGEHDEKILFSILRQLCSAVCSCDNYLLDCSCLVLEPDLIFIEPENLQVKLAYLPYKAQEKPEDESAAAAFKKAAAGIIAMTGDIQNTAAIKGLTAAINREDFCIPDFKRRIEQVLEGNYRRFSVQEKFDKREGEANKRTLSVKNRTNPENTERRADIKRTAKKRPIPGQLFNTIKMYLHPGGSYRNEGPAAATTDEETAPADNLSCFSNNKHTAAPALNRARTTPERASADLNDDLNIPAPPPIFNSNTGQNSDDSHSHHSGKTTDDGCSHHSGRTTDDGCSHHSGRTTDDRTQPLNGSMLETAFLRSLAGNETVELPPGKDSTLVGRKREFADCVIDNKAIGRVHAEISRRGDAYYIKDLNSKNGTFINNVRLEPEKESVINNKDIITFANKEYFFLTCE